MPSSNAYTCPGSFAQYDDTSDDPSPPHPDVHLLPTDTLSLAKYLNPLYYLQLCTLKTIMAKFVDKSNLKLQGFLIDELTAALEEGLGEADLVNRLDGTSHREKVPSHRFGVPPSLVVSAMDLHAICICFHRFHAPIEHA